MGARGRTTLGGRGDAAVEAVAPGKLLVALVATLAILASPSCAATVSHDGRALIIDGERKLIVSGAIHYPRSTPEMWPDLIQKAKDGGLDAIETYVFWNAHEPQRRQYTFDGNLDIIRFLQEIHAAGLYAIVRIGPYVCAEWNYGGLPVWLHQLPGIELRTDNQRFKEEMQSFVTLIIDMFKQERLLAPQGGPIVLTQIENEYGNSDIGPQYGEAGKRYVKWCAQMAESMGTGIPWIMCQQDDAPAPVINTHNGFYFGDFVPNSASSPKMWTENWSGWFQGWGMGHLHRPVEDLAYSAAVFFQSNGSLLNYYMYHGGTNFDRTSGGPYITTSYDYDAPLDEYGNLRQPKWGHLRDLHSAVKSMEKALLYGLSKTTDLGNGAVATKYSVAGTVPGCFLVNNDHSTDKTVKFEGNQYILPPKSVSILPDCKAEVYNTAKVTAQTSYMVMQPNEAEDEPSKLNWSWRPENIQQPLQGKGTHTANRLLEQIIVSGDESDYLWYSTTVTLKNQQMTLRINSTGHVLHVFINGKLVASRYPQSGKWPYTSDVPITVVSGKNIITLLSVTVGLKNYGAFYDKSPTGIVNGPVLLIGSGNDTTDLSSSKWSYTVGLDGEDKQLYSDNPRHSWHSDVLPIKRPFTWYSTTFKPPLGTAPVVLDLLGMGKGEAWVNGKSIGRFWPSNIADESYGVACGQCDYRETLNTSYVPCQSGCGEPSQRYYHVPRYFMNPGVPNTLILFEEIGGNPTEVSFQTVTVGEVCAAVPEGTTLELACQDWKTVSEIRFASFGNPQGTCGLFATGLLTKGDCESSTALSAIQKACVGKQSCSIDASENSLGWSNCGSKAKTLLVHAIC